MPRRQSLIPFEIRPRGDDPGTDGAYIHVTLLRPVTPESKHFNRCTLYHLSDCNYRRLFCGILYRLYAAGDSIAMTRKVKYEQN